MKFNLPYIINLPPFMFRGVDVNKMNTVEKLFFIFKGKFLSLVINKVNGKAFCKIVNLFYREESKIYFQDNLYKKEINYLGNISYPNKRILRMVNNHTVQLNKLIDSYCISDIEIKDGDVVIDCGANVGELNLALKSKKINIQYIAFEPDPEAFECLKLNNSENINTLYSSALSNKIGTQNLHLDSLGGNSSLLNFGENKSIEVSSTTLDSLNIKDSIKLFKVEAEGFEPEVVNGSINTLKNINFVSVDFGHERGPEQKSTIVEVNKLLLENNFELIKFIEHRLILLYENKKYR
jgi:FkbM family methyltransferase